MYDEKALEDALSRQKQPHSSHIKLSIGLSIRGAVIIEAFSWDFQGVQIDLGAVIIGERLYLEHLR